MVCCTPVNDLPEQADFTTTLLATTSTFQRAPLRPELRPSKPANHAESRHRSTFPYSRILPQRPTLGTNTRVPLSRWAHPQPQLASHFPPFQVQKWGGMSNGSAPSCVAFGQLLFFGTNYKDQAPQHLGLVPSICLFGPRTARPASPSDRPRGRRSNRISPPPSPRMPLRIEAEIGL